MAARQEIARQMAEYLYTITRHGKATQASNGAQGESLVPQDYASRVSSNPQSCEASWPLHRRICTKETDRVSGPAECYQHSTEPNPQSEVHRYAGSIYFITATKKLTRVRVFLLSRRAGFPRIHRSKTPTGRKTHVAKSPRACGPLRTEASRSVPRSAGMALSVGTRGCVVSPRLRVKRQRFPHPDRWLIAALFALLLLGVALTVLR